MASTIVDWRCPVIAEISPTISPSDSSARKTCAPPSVGIETRNRPFRITNTQWRRHAAQTAWRREQSGACVGAGPRGDASRIQAATNRVDARKPWQSSMRCAQAGCRERHPSCLRWDRMGGARGLERPLGRYDRGGLSGRGVAVPVSAKGTCRVAASRPMAPISSAPEACKETQPCAAQSGSPSDGVASPPGASTFIARDMGWLPMAVSEAWLRPCPR